MEAGSPKVDQKQVPYERRMQLFNRSYAIPFMVSCLATFSTGAAAATPKIFNVMEHIDESNNGNGTRLQALGPCSRWSLAGASR